MPFIFMNASGKMRDVETLVHEAGHAVHTFLSAPLELNSFKNNIHSQPTQKYETIICQVYSQRNESVVEEFGLIQHDIMTMCLDLFVFRACATNVQ